MDTVIGLGNAGCRIADRFGQYEEYDVYKMDAGLKRTARTYGIKEKKTPEEYEQGVGNLKRFFKEVKKEVLFIVGGSGLIAGASLRILQQINACNITILYVYSDPELLGEVARVHQRVTGNVFQEYARSGAIEKVILVNNCQLEDILDSVPIIGFYEHLNELVVPTIHMVNVLNNSKSVMDNISAPHEVSRVVSYGLVDYKTGEEKLFFPLDTIREKVYYYAINEERLKESGDIRKKIINQIKKNSLDTTTSYGIYSTQYDADYVYCVAYSSQVQQLD